MAPVVLLVPGSLETRTGGYEYDRRMVHGLRRRGWAVDVETLDGGFPTPTATARVNAARRLAAIPDRTTVLIDGLALGALPDEVHRVADRLRVVALVHHPLAAETGLDATLAARLRASERRALAAARCVVVTSQATATTIACEYGVAMERIAVVEPGTEPRPLATGSADGALHMVCVATLVPRKGHEILLGALADVVPCHWRLTCAGSATLPGSTADRLQAQVHTRGLAGRVTLAGEADALTLAALYDSADLFVLPTLHEGYGMAVAEALACGLPVVSTATGAIPDLVGDAGLIVPPGDRHALVLALARMMDDQVFRGRCARAARHIRHRLPTWTAAVTKMAAALDPGRLQ